jgi:hypothetical protein
LISSLDFFQYPCFTDRTQKNMPTPSEMKKKEYEKKMLGQV